MTYRYYLVKNRKTKQNTIMRVNESGGWQKFNVEETYNNLYMDKYYTILAELNLKEKA